jgi:hypothetical protein
MADPSPEPRSNIDAGSGTDAVTLIEDNGWRDRTYQPVRSDDRHFDMHGGCHEGKQTMRMT